MAALLGTVDGGALLRLADEVDAFVFDRSPCAMLCGEVVFALTLGEGDQRNVLGGGRAARCDRRSGGVMGSIRVVEAKGLLAMSAKEADHAYSTICSLGT